MTIVMTAIGLVALISMLALAIDVVNLYVSAGEAQKAADAAAVAGAKAFVSSGFTSGQLGDPSLGVAQGIVCGGGSGLAEFQAQAAAGKNLTGTASATVTIPACVFSNPENPRISVIVTRTGLPTFFARIWGAGANSLTVRANAEAYNPSGSTIPIEVESVKPWLISNCDPNSVTPPPCTGNPYFVDSTASYIVNPTAPYVGQFFQFKPTKTPLAGGYYALDLTPATVCPSPSAQPAGSCSQLGSSLYHDNIACADATNTPPLSCGAIVNVLPNTGTPAIKTRTVEGTQCLVHTVSIGNPPPISCATPADSDPDCFTDVSGSPVGIKGGQSNPDPNMQGVANISRSDSVVTVPIFDFQNATNDPCLGGACGTATVMGFLQLGIQSVSPTGTIGAYVLNVAGCNPTPSGNPVSGGGVSPIPVRLND